MARTPISLPFDGRLLREARERRGWNQEHLAQKATETGTRVSRFQVVRAETGRNKPKADTLVAFAQALDMEIDEFLNQQPQQKAS